MKRILLYSSLILIGLASGCAPKPVSPVVAAGPEGTFTGQFMYIHIHSKTGVIDTSKANIQLQMEQSTGFKVTGDTSTVHAGSFGSYIVNTTYGQVDFLDHTYPTTGTPTKFHLNGIYAYNYDGTILKMVAYSAFDTLTYFYTLKRSGN